MLGLRVEIRMSREDGRHAGGSAGGFGTTGLYVDRYRAWRAVSAVGGAFVREFFPLEHLYCFST